jgi:hypothetical protein
MKPSDVAPVSDAAAAVFTLDDVGNEGREDVSVVERRVGLYRFEDALRCQTSP